MGNKKEMLTRAMEELVKYFSSIVCSPIYETKPWGFAEQENFFNMVIKVETVLLPQEVVGVVKESEKKLGRKKRFFNGPREIDIDLLFYDDLILQESDLIIPHPRLGERDFVLKPFMDINPEFVDPVTERTVEELYRALPEGAKTVIRQVTL